MKNNKQQITAYILFEKEDTIEQALNQIGITIRNLDGTIRTTNEVLEQIAGIWRSELYL